MGTRKRQAQPSVSAGGRATSVLLADTDVLRRLDDARGRVLSEHGILISRSSAFEIGLNLLLDAPNIAVALRTGELRRKDVSERRLKAQV